MVNNTDNILKTKLEKENYQKLKEINNPALHKFVAEFVALGNPDKVFVCNNSPEDIAYIKERTIKNGEESKLSIEGHTIHFDSYYDQGRDKEHTNILVPPSIKLDDMISTRNKEAGITEIKEIYENIMKGHELYVCFFCLGPTNSEFSVPCVQLTDSSYVAHNEFLLYRPGYKEFIRQGFGARFFKFVHSQGEVDTRKVSKNIDKRRIYIDPEDDIVYSVNTQYGGNSIGLKKLAMRLSINRCVKEGWLTEHMLIMGIHGPENRVTYIAGAFPSLCGKTSTAMLDGETIVGDDIAFLRKKGEEVRAVNVEKGMFGIIQGINSKDDPILWKALQQPGEVIFSNILVTEEKGVHWLGKDGEVPARGYNHSGEWWRGKTDAKGKEIPCSHPNARFTLGLNILENLDPKLDDPQGVVIRGIVYGGRDSDTWVPVEESFDWVHGIVTKGASLESETTAATLGAEGIRELNPMSNIDFLSISIGKYIEQNINFGADLINPPLIFGINYFLKDKEGKFLNEKTDKKIWYKWMELRANGGVGFIKTPTGRIPKYEDLKRLFREVLGKDYAQKDYDTQFMIRVSENLAKIDRVGTIFKHQVSNTPPLVFKVLAEQKQRLNEARENYGDYILPDKFTG